MAGGDLAAWLFSSSLSGWASIALAGVVKNLLLETCRWQRCCRCRVLAAVRGRGASPSSVESGLDSLR